MICKRLSLLLFISLLSASSLLLWCTDALAQPIVYTKTILTLLRQQPITTTVEIEEEEDTDTAETPEDANQSMDSSPAAPRVQQVTQAAPPHPITVEVRSSQIPTDQGLITNYALDTTHGVLTYFVSPEPRALEAENIYSAVDVLFVTDEGIIAQIVPDIQLAQLSSAIEAEFSVRAFLYLEAGASAALGITPGDRLEHDMFSPAPQVLKREE